MTPEFNIPFVTNSGLKVLEASRGYAKCLMPLDGNQNHVNIMYAGALCTLAEFPVGILYVHTFDVKRFFPIVKSIQVKFIRPAVTDIVVDVSLNDEQIKDITQRAAEHGKADFELNTELKATDGTVVAVGHVVYQLRVL